MHIPARMAQVDSPFRAVTGWMIVFINSFGRSGGFKAIRDALTAQDISLARIRELLVPVFVVRDYLTSEFLNWFFTCHEAATKPVLALSDEELKNDFRIASDIVTYICGLFRYCTRCDASEAMELVRLSFALKGFRSPFLERRLVGLTEICNFVEEVHMAYHRTGASKAETEDKPWVTPEYLLEWLSKNEILASIFSRNLHVEVVKRCVRILIFLSANRRLDPSDIELIWTATLGKHESVQKAVLESLFQFLCHQPSPHSPETYLKVLELHEKLRPADYISCNINIIRMVSYHLATKNFHLEPSQSLVAVRLLWRLVQDDVRFSQQELHSNCMTCILEAIDYVNSSTCRCSLFSEGVKNLRMHRCHAMQTSCS
jgi:hypothetical protein